jgi:hypothetical protein
MERDRGPGSRMTFLLEAGDGPKNSRASLIAPFTSNNSIANDANVDRKDRLMRPLKTWLGQRAIRMQPVVCRTV